MAAKYCRDCKYRKRMPIQQGNQAGMIDVCIHEEFGDPVTGESMAAMQVRSIKELCGLDGKGFVNGIPDKEDAPKLVLGG